MKQKNIVMVSYDYLPNIGGIAIYVHELSKALQKLGHKVTILTSFESTDVFVKREWQDDLEIYRVPISRVKKLNDYQYKTRMRNLIKELEETREIDVIHWQTLNKDAKMMRSVKVSGIEVYTNHLSWFRMLFRKKKYKKIKRLVGHPDFIICPSKETASMCKLLFDNTHSGFLPNGVNKDQFEKKGIAEIRELKAQLGISQSDKIIVTTNRMEPIKGMTYFIEAIPLIVENHPNTTFLIVGDGSEEKKLEKWIQEQIVPLAKVKFLGRKDNKDVRDILSLADLYVQPSLMEGSSIAILEAMASEKPIIACNIGGNPDIVMNGSNGLLIEEKSSQAISDAVTHLFNDPDMSAFMGTQGRKKVEEWLNWEILAKEVDAIYDFARREKKE